MGFFDDLGNAFTGKSSQEIANKQLQMQQDALKIYGAKEANNAANQSTNTMIMIIVIVVILVILGFVTYILTKTKT